MKNNKRDRVSVGGASIILIMLVLALSSFALLAIRSSMNERRLATKTAKSIKEYYEMDAEATEIYADINETIKDGKHLGEGLSTLREKYQDTIEAELEDENSFFAKYSVTRGERTLYIEVAGDKENITILRWSTKTASEDGLYEIQITD